MRIFKLLLLSVALLPLSMFAQTFHAIIFANTKCPESAPGKNDAIGPSVTVDFQRMGLEMTTIAKSIGYKLQKYYYYDTPDRFCKSSLIKVLNELSCKPNDIVFFYYSGHGARANDEETKFPSMCMTVDPHTPISELVPLHDVYKTIKAKSPRLTIVMGDLCNSFGKGYYKNRNKDKGATVLTKEVCDLYKSLFLNVKGGLVAASSKPGQTSDCAQYKDGSEAGGYFTYSFLECLQYCVENDIDVSWDNLMEEVIGFTQELTKNKTDEDGNPSPQTPVYQPELSIAEAPTSTSNVNNVPQAPTQSDDAATNQQDNLAYAMSVVGNMNVSLYDRIRNIQTALKYFSPTAKVQVVGCNNSTIVRTSSAESYLNYLSMATTIDQVVVLDMKKDGNGKITYARVHEIHYK